MPQVSSTVSRGGAVDAQGLVTSPPCELCGQPIGPDRIDALPRATTCMACASLRKRPSRGQTCS
ncbi:MAG: TraR/DksA C4-type zinc finger protein [Nocardioides sp.]